MQCEAGTLRKIGRQWTEPYPIEEIQSLLLEASKLRNSARRVIALALGLRQGEAPGLMWQDAYRDAGYIRVRKNGLGDALWGSAGEAADPDRDGNRDGAGERPRCEQRGLSTTWTCGEAFGPDLSDMVSDGGE
ncbi:hypothetical protein ACFY0G_29100 [Streptomyces sp. NPDC001552]|uniref:hypothetical protein n=1 Tax=Streptomyces sp. NPDC001552 TaxID=3364587 RepID=UPI00368F6360